MSTYQLVTRPQWHARPPERETKLDWRKVTRFIVHYSGASRQQTVRSIQDFCMDNKGHSDIDYNMLIRGPLLYVGRADNVGSHTLNNNSTSYGVCIIGRDGDATDDDFRTCREWYDELCARTGRKLAMTTHRGVLGANYTDCPGDEIAAWVAAGMPYPKRRKVFDMFYLQVEGNQDVYVSDGVRTRLMPPGTWDTTVEKLEHMGIPHLMYKDMDALLAGGGPLDTPAPSLPKQVTVVVPEQELAVSLS